MRFFPVILAAFFFSQQAAAQPGVNDPTFNPPDNGHGWGDASPRSVSVVKVLPDGKILLGGLFKEFNDYPCGGFIRINPDGSLDPTWNPGGTGVNIGSYGAAGIAVQPDGKILVSGDFTQYNGVTRNRIARLHPDGTLDLSFDPAGGFDVSGGEIIVLPDGKILVGGSFTTVNGAPCTGLVKLNSDGSRDLTFNNGGSGPAGSVTAMDVLPNGRILIGGPFLSYNGTQRIRIAGLLADGSLDTTFTPGYGAYAVVRDILHQPDGQILIAGDFGTYDKAKRVHIARLNPDGTNDLSFNSFTGANNNVYNIRLLPDGRVLACGAFTAYKDSVRSCLVRLFPDGSVDPTFTTGSGFSSFGYTITGLDIAMLPDGKTIVTGAFKMYDNVYYNHVAKINADGTPDPTFSAGTGANDGRVATVVAQPDGKLLVGGGFNRYNGLYRLGFTRLNSDGTPDPAFANTSAGADYSSHYVSAAIVQPDGKILVAGSFGQFSGVSRNNLVRLNSDGTVDLAFDAQITGLDTIHALVQQPDGKIIIGGKFSAVAGIARNNLARLNPDGTLDATFTVGNGTNAPVRALALQPDGKLLVAGEFTSYRSTARNRIVRVNEDGTVDAAFIIGNGANNSIYCMALQPDGKILIGGNFTVYAFTLPARIQRLNPDGSADSLFNPGSGFNGKVYTLVVRPDGKLLAGGGFTTFNGVSRRGLACLNANGSLNAAFDPGAGAQYTTDVRSILVLPNERMIIAGNFTRYNGTGRNRIARLMDPANTTSTISPEVCDSYTSPSGNAYSVSGVYEDVIPNSNGADSIITINLTVHSSLAHTDVVTSCTPYTWIDGNTYFSSTSTPVFTLNTASGCDSVVSLNLTINGATAGTDVVSSCGPYTWINGVTYFSDNSTATHILTNAAGCDSVVTLQLSVHAPTSGTAVVTACDSYTWIDGMTYISDNSTATHTLTSAAGCDSVVTLNLTVIHSTAGTDVVTACDAYTWIDGVMYTSSNNTATHTLVNAAGCDSVVTLDLTVHHSAAGTAVAEACGSYSWIDGNTYTSSNTTATYLLQTTAGCDSLVTLNLTITPFPTASVMDNGDATITASGGTAYQWLDCGTNQPISGETDPDFAPAVNGTYAAIVSNAAGCADTSDCVTIDYIGIEENSLSGVTLYPNPTDNDVTISFAEPVAEVTVRDAHDKLILAQTITSGSSVSLADFQSGVYFFELSTKKGQVVKRVVKHD